MIWLCMQGWAQEETCKQEAEARWEAFKKGAFEVRVAATMAKTWKRGAALEEEQRKLSE